MNTRTSRSRCLTAAFLGTGLLGLAGCTTLSPEAQTAALIAQVEAATGSARVKTLTVTTRGSGGSVGQAFEPGMAWPGLQYKALARALNFEDSSFREEYIQSRSEALGGGPAPPLGAGEARGVVLARADHAWDVAGTALISVPADVPMRMHDLWLSTPQGAIRAAARLGARAGVRRAFLRRWDTLSFEMPGRFSATLVIEDTGLISRIEASVVHPLLGRMPVSTRFLDYRPHADLTLPSHIVQTQGGHPALDVELSAVVANDPVLITLPEEVRAKPEPLVIEKVAEGVWFLSGGSHHSVAIEQETQLVLVQLPSHPGRAQLVLAAARRLADGKPVTTVISTHHHFDHAGGLREAVAEGLVVYTSAPAKAWFEQLFAARPDGAAAAAGTAARQPVFRAVAGDALLADEGNPIHIHEVRDSRHARGLLMVWLPRSRLLVQAAAFTPGAAPAADAPADVNHLNLVQNLDRLGLAPRLILPLQGWIVPAADLYRSVGRPAPP